MRTEPDTHSLLLGELSKSDCRRIFPKQYASKDYRDKFDAFIAATELVASPSCELSVEARRALVQSKIDALPSVRREDTQGLRIDIALENETTGETVWGDVTSVHPGSESYADQELKSLCTRQIAAHVSNAISQSNSYRSLLSQNFKIFKAGGGC